MNGKHELNDIILNKGVNNNSNKKIVLAVATLGVILIVVVMLMNSLSSNGTDNLPQEPLQQIIQDKEEPLFEEVIVIEEETSTDENLALIAQKLKEESLAETETITPIAQAQEPVLKQEKTITKPVKAKQTTTKVASGSYYIQVGSFSKYKPNKKFLDSITRLGYAYKFHKMSNLNKVLVGPFTSSSKAKNARRVLRSKVEPGSFLVKL